MGVNQPLPTNPSFPHAGDASRKARTMLKSLEARINAFPIPLYKLIVVKEDHSPLFGDGRFVSFADQGWLTT
jgi:hypothetical protein